MRQWHRAFNVRETRLLRGHTALQRSLELLEVDVLAITCERQTKQRTVSAARCSAERHCVGTAHAARSAWLVQWRPSLQPGLCKAHQRSP